MTVTVASFRSAFPEFADATVYTDASVQMWLSASVSLLSPERWGDLLDLGTSLFVAHNIVLGAMNARAASKGGSPGSGGGVTASKAVDKVSVSYDTGAATIEGAASWNLTTYGTRYLQLARMVGAGGLQISPGY